MDFIERLLGISPDDGNGTTEVLWLVTLAILLGAAAWWRRYRAEPQAVRSRSLQRRLGVPVRKPKQARFTSTARTRVGDHEAVLVISQSTLPDAAGLVGAIVLIDGADHAVYDAVAKEKPIRRGQPVMMTVRKLP